MNEVRYLPASRTAQILLMLLAVFGIVISAVIYWLSFLAVPPEGSARAVLDSYAHTVNLGTWLVFAVSILFAAAWSYYLGRMGIQGLACGEFPPPGTLVAFRTKIRAGRMAVLSSWLAILIAIAFWLPAITFAYSLFLIDKYTY